MYLDSIIPFTMPTKIIHGLGAIKQIPDECKRLGIKKAILVTDDGLVKAGVPNEIRNILEGAKIPYVTFEKVEEDPSMKTVHDGDRLRRAEGCDGVVILGGGSPLCAGKGIAVLGTNGGKIADYAGVGKLRLPPLPVIGIPTTAGSGSEVSPTFILTNEEEHNKFAIGSELGYPPTAILDPTLLRSLPPRQAIWSSLDALSHAVEALFTNFSTPLTDAIALRAIHMMSRNIAPAAFTTDIIAKSEQLLASAMANIACGNAKLGLVHGFSNPLGNLHIPHGLACGLMLPFVMEFNLPSSKGKFAQMALAMGESGNQPEDVLANKAVQRVRNLYLEVGFPTKVTEKQVPKDKLDQLIKETSASSQMKFNVRQASEQDLRWIMERAYAGF